MAAVVVAAMAMCSGYGFASGPGEPPVNRSRQGVGLEGFDPVSYFDAAPAAGQPAIVFVLDGTTYRFASEANRDRFVKEPARFLPQYGGFCAYAVSRGYTAAIDPLAWKVVDGKLYLNYSKRVQKRWEEDVPGNIARGDRNWPAIASKR